MAKKKKAAKEYPRRMLVKGIPAKYDQYPWKNGDYVLMLAEIVRMPGHYVIVDAKGLTHFGYHGDFMEDLDKDE